jgi:hypothetical protein
MRGDVLELNLNDALTLKRAELWLEVGRPILALREMLKLSYGSWGHPSVSREVDAVCASAVRYPADAADATPASAEPRPGAAPAKIEKPTVVQLAT